MHTFKIQKMKKVWKKRMQIPLIFCNRALYMTSFKRVLHFFVLRKIFPSGSYIEVFLKWVYSCLCRGGAQSQRGGSPISLAQTQKG